MVVPEKARIFSKFLNTFANPVCMECANFQLPKLFPCNACGVYGVFFEPRCRCGGRLSTIRMHNRRKYRHCYSCHFDFYLEEETNEDQT